MARIVNLILTVTDRDREGGPVVAVEPVPDLTVFLPPEGKLLRNPRQRISGRTASENLVTVTVRDLERVGTIIDLAVDAGANLSSGITFRMSGANPGADRALTEAVADARRKAELLATAGGAALGQVITITELSSSITPPVVYAEAATADGAATQVLPPTIESQVSVGVTWSLVEVAAD
jgi:uncharacterized protein YggE